MSGDPMLPRGTNYCLCRPCGRYFRTVRAFERHRRGEAGNRSCVADPRELGLELDGSGYWRFPPRPRPNHLRGSTGDDTLPRAGETG